MAATPLYHEIVCRARRAGLAGAGVLHGIEGYGASRRVHTTRILSPADSVPLMIVIIDTEEAIRDFLPQLDEFLAEALVVVDPVEVIRDADRPHKPARQGDAGVSS
ncbi:DUF190 domain-containing protein [Nonomuraea sp. K274]|uniref:DUF190 domain-containing protein n=1 Tax=Nonomuraea cypriaca TaxID=1187855 RepID=A0A931AD06_9ACTN|nr:DUF190 domain-containing protein [Nonomuraea cypriaca]MBF8187022.1 DUF190 domain-containing protein [Nonomuraea cypriaca]